MAASARILSLSGSVELFQIEPEVVAAARELVYDHARYFEITEGTVFFTTAALVCTRHHPEGIRNALGRMALAYENRYSKRSPISVRKLNLHDFVILDGNATATVAMAADWADIPCTISD